MSATGFEFAANAVNALAIVLAGRNSVHTWWTGIAGCGLFSVMFYDVRLYADVTLQIFFIATSLLGWLYWWRAGAFPRSDIASSGGRTVAVGVGAGVLCAAAYGSWLAANTDAAAPFADSLVLAFSVVAQCLLMRRRLETWWFWIVVNLISVPLFASRGLWITAALYLAFLLHAMYALRHWRRLVIVPAP